MQTIISIHDVMPCYMDKVSAILDRLPPPCVKNVMLLVVPGLPWSPEQIDQLRDWQQSGHILAGHGWLHQSRGYGGLYHRLHAALLSRNAAEHLVLDPDAIDALIRRNHDWFTGNALQAPDYYVPPAWAMGKISRQRLNALPFRFYETTFGIYDSKRDRFTFLPLAGFEADNRFRQYGLRFWNGINKLICSPRRPLRISIHPNDFSLMLARSLQDQLHAADITIHYRELAERR